MKRTLQFVLSLIFIVQMYVMMALIGLIFIPISAVKRTTAYTAVRIYCRYVRWSARVIVGLDSEIRGQVPTDAVIIASKHQSFFDIIMIVSVCPRPKFIMKKELTRAPILGWYAKRLACIPVDRGKRGAAIQQMLAEVAFGRVSGGQLIIYPQGTRVAPGASKSYKTGTGALYAQMDQACVPAATNVGVFWPRHGFMRKRGLAVVEFLEPIQPGLANDDFMHQLEHQIESKSNALMEEAGFKRGNEDVFGN